MNATGETSCPTMNANRFLFSSLLLLRHYIFHRRYAQAAVAARTYAPPISVLQITALERVQLDRSDR